MNRMVLSESNEILRIFLQELTRITGTRLVGNRLWNYTCLGDSRQGLLNRWKSQLDLGSMTGCLETVHNST